MTEATPVTPRFDDAGVDILHDGLTLARYVFRPDARPAHAPKPYLAPVRSLTGENVTVVRPHDHPWHNGFQLALPYVGDWNFWGGPTYVAGEGYVDRLNSGRMRHEAFDRIAAQGARLDLGQTLSWLAPSGAEVAAEARTLTFDAAGAAQGVWRLGLDSRIVNRTSGPLRLSSPTVEGRPAAGYGGWVWRGPRSFTGGQVVAPERVPDAMGARLPWLAFVGRHDGSGRATTVVMRVPDDAPPPPWFVRNEPYAIMGPAPFYAAPQQLASGETLRLTCEVHIADGRLTAPAIASLLAAAAPDGGGVGMGTGA